MDDPTLAQLTATNNPALSNYQFTGTESPVVAALRAKLPPEQMQQLQYGNIGPGGRDPKSGRAYSWLPYDPAQKLFDSHQHFGPTYDDPTYGKLQSLYAEPSKSQRDFNKIGPILFGLGLSAVTGGAGASWLTPFLKSGIGYGATGNLNINPLDVAKSGASLAGFDPSLISLAKMVGP